jgi:hypothetical protein
VVRIVTRRQCMKSGIVNTTASDGPETLIWTVLNPELELFLRF